MRISRRVFAWGFACGIFLLIGMIVIVAKYFNWLLPYAAIVCLFSFLLWCGYQIADEFARR